MKTLKPVYHYFFNKLYFFYIKIGEDDMPELYAVCIITLMEVFNILSIILLSSAIFGVSLRKFDKNYGFLIFAIVLALNLWYFKLKQNKFKILEWYKSIDSVSKKLYDRCFYFYFTLSVIIFVISIFVPKNYM